MRNGNSLLRNTVLVFYLYKMSPRLFLLQAMTNSVCKNEAFNPTRQGQRRNFKVVCNPSDPL